jgi:hypothetical protein
VRKFLTQKVYIIGSTSVENLLLNLPDFFLNLQKRKNAKTQKRKNAKTQKRKNAKTQNAKGFNPELKVTYINKIVIYTIILWIIS